MALSFICDICNHVSFAFKDFYNNFISLEHDKEFSWDVCPKCRDSILKHIELLSKIKEESE